MENGRLASMLSHSDDSGYYRQITGEPASRGHDREISADERWTSSGGGR
jgi:hypothetical protein